MSYQAIFNAFAAASDWLVNQFFYPFVNWINTTPLISTALLVLLGVPAVLSVLYIYRFFGSSAESMTQAQDERMVMRIRKVDKRLQKQEYQQRQQIRAARQSGRAYAEIKRDLQLMELKSGSRF